MPRGDALLLSVLALLVCSLFLWAVAWRIFSCCALTASVLFTGRDEDGEMSTSKSIFPIFPVQTSTGVWQLSAFLVQKAAGGASWVARRATHRDGQALLPEVPGCLRASVARGSG